MRVYLRNQPHPRAPIWLIVGTRHILVCDEFAKWFRRKFGEEADLQDVYGPSQPAVASTTAGYLWPAMLTVCPTASLWLVVIEVLQVVG